MSWNWACAADAAGASGDAHRGPKNRIRGLGEAALICILVGTLPTYGTHRGFSPLPVRLAVGAADYLLDGASVFAEYDASNSLSARYLLHPQVIDEMLEIEQGGQKYFPLTDALGSVYALADSSGAVVHSFTYDVYGKRSDAGGAAPSVAWGFTGREQDATGLNYHRDRYMDPARAHWTQADRIGLRDGPNVYGYAHLAPTMFLDPMGMETEVLFSQPYGAGASSLGHIAVRINTKVYSFAVDPDGVNDMEVVSAAYYMTDEDYRDVIGLVLYLTPEEELQLTTDMVSFGHTYKWNQFVNCTIPIQEGMVDLGSEVAFTEAPHLLMAEIAASGRAIATTYYPSAANAKALQAGKKIRASGMSPWSAGIWRYVTNLRSL